MSRWKKSVVTHIVDGEGECLGLGIDLELLFLADGLQVVADELQAGLRQRGRAGQPEVDREDPQLVHRGEAWGQWVEVGWSRDGPYGQMRDRDKGAVSLSRI